MNLNIWRIETLSKKSLKKNKKTYYYLMSINTPQPSRVDIKRIISQLEVKLLLPTAKAIVDILEMTKNNPTALFTMASMLVLE